jgi:hypothetical protein
MSSGPEHYRNAEERIKASDWQRQEGHRKDAMHEAAMAQAHATLALAAAVALSTLHGMPCEDTEAWLQACSGVAW